MQPVGLINIIQRNKKYTVIYESGLQTSQVLKFPKSEIFAGDYVKGWSVLCLLCDKGQKILDAGACSPRKSCKFAGNAPSSQPFFFKRCLLRASMLLWSAWANASAYTSYINRWKSWRNKKIGRTHWTLAERQCQWRNELGIHEHFWKLKG